jgi:hypothetical protein
MMTRRYNLPQLGFFQGFECVGIANDHSIAYGCAALAWLPFFVTSDSVRSLKFEPCKRSIISCTYRELT